MFWIQHGYGKGTKLRELARGGALEGVILSPADETPDALKRTAQELSELNVRVLVDPQTYVWSIPDGAAVRHKEHGLDFGQFSWSPTPGQVRGITEAVIRLNAEFDTEAIITPTCIQRTFNDQWTGLAVRLARDTLSASDGRDVFVSVVVEESALRDWIAIEQWLEVATALDVRGFYIVVARSGYLKRWEQASLVNLMRLVRRLGPLNEYEVILGYSDLDGLLPLSVGASGLATGWYQTLRSFTESKWQPRTGGGPSKPRVTSPPLLTPFMVAEGSPLAASALGRQVFPDDYLRARLVGSPNGISIADGWMQHLETVQSLVASVEAAGTEAAEVVRAAIERASTLFSRLETEGQPLSIDYRGRMNALLRSAQAFADLDEAV